MIVGIVGAGHIAHALAEGWVRPSAAAPPSLLIFDIEAARAEALAAATGGAAAASAADVAASSDLVLVAVRPPEVEAVLAQLAPAIGERPLVSVAAGVTLERLLAALPPGSRVARVMPNVAAALGLGVFLLVPGTLTPGQAEDVRALFAASGTVLELPEELFDAATSVAGCMPGVLAALVGEFAAAAEAHGIAPAVARRLAVEGAHGAAAMIAAAGDPEAIIAAAATPGGMTAAAIEALAEQGAGAAVAAAVAAATARAKELA